MDTMEQRVACTFYVVKEKYSLLEEEKLLQKH